MNALRVFVIVGALTVAATSVASQHNVSANQGPATSTMTDAAGASTAAPVAKRGLTREQVRAELAEARRHGLLSANPNQYPSEYIEHAQRQMEALAQQDVDIHEKALID